MNENNSFLKCVILILLLCAVHTLDSNWDSIKNNNLYNVKKLNSYIISENNKFFERIHIQEIALNTFDYVDDHLRNNFDCEFVHFKFLLSLNDVDVTVSVIYEHEFSSEYVKNEIVDTTSNAIYKFLNFYIWYELQSSQIITLRVNINNMDIIIMGIDRELYCST